jgi:hypothetical protein
MDKIGGKYMSNLTDQDRIRWPGSGSAVPGKTPFAMYDNDPQFVYDCQAAAVWAARRLGYPIVDIELVDYIFYACYEESVNEYANQLNSWNIINNISNLQGMNSSGSNISGLNVNGSSLPYIINLADFYGSEAGVGGSVPLKQGHVDVVQGKQNYDLQALWGDVTESFDRMEIRKVFHNMPPASARIYDPFSMTGMSYSNVLNEMGFGSYSPAVQFLMCPIFEDLLRMQGIEFNDMVRKSAYSFELMDNKIKIFPIPTYNFKMYFDYVLKKDKYNGMIQGGSNYQYVSDFSNVPYNNIIYSRLNQPSKQWIKKYFLACCKEVLGCIRQKYQTVPIPGGEVTLDGAELRSEAKEEKTELITNLRDMLEKSGRSAQLELKALEADTMKEVLKTVPTLIYVAALTLCFIFIGI